MTPATKKCAYTLVMIGSLVFTAPYALAELKGMTDREMMDVTAQSGIATLQGERATEEQRREEKNRQDAIQVLSTLNAIVPSDVLREIRDMNHTVQQPHLIHREFQTVSQDLLMMPAAAATVITIPAGIGTGGFFF
ncbi:hypothetical protein [Desulfoluna butyratoxydans]|uniref:Uncharacterized protein n=1 Tax=Desulfoluna butyratoxydans TaxID=231438 RepID=A0A4U8YTT2_9BACT|nr:hypothetical protein [Desulfoluna butyratoxydans]VFQ45282.1 hypothetical protein MSL71_29390 [Desulfoluna butyratoxydans]